MSKMGALWLEKYETIFQDYMDGFLTMDEAEKELKGLGLSQEDIKDYMDGP